MRNAQLYLANVSWRGPDQISDIAPGKTPIAVSQDSLAHAFEASMPAYAREEGHWDNCMQLAVKSALPCYIVFPTGDEIQMTEHVHADTGEHWWIEKGPWVSRGRYHDAPSFHRPGGTLDIRVAEERCRIQLFQPSLTQFEFRMLLDDIKNWCWRMAIDESCYVAVEQNQEIRLLSEDFLRLAEDFIRSMSKILELPHCELREAIEDQRIERLKPNNHSLRFLAQRGERSVVPGRAAAQHYNTPENRFALAMLRRVNSILRWTANAAADRAIRFERSAEQYIERALDLKTRTTERINPAVLDENLRRARKKRDELQVFIDQGMQMLTVTSREGYWANTFHGKYENLISMIHLGYDDVSMRIRQYLSRSSSVVIFGVIQSERRTFNNGNPYNWCDVVQLTHIDVWRDYWRECEALETKRRTAERNGWVVSLRPDVLLERKNEAKTLQTRSQSLADAALTTKNDAEAAAGLIAKARVVERKALNLAITPDLRFVPTMVFLQSPHYAGALSAYRQLMSITGIDDTIMEGLLSLEQVGLCDWPTVYERWCLVSLLRVLQDDFRFVFNKEDVTKSLLQHCTGRIPGAFVSTAVRTDMNLRLSLAYQPTLVSGKTPDFILEITDIGGNQKVRCVLDAKSCAFEHRPPDAHPRVWRYLDDCLNELVNLKDYGEGGRNWVFLLHSVKTCGCAECKTDESARGPITQPTTLQSWATSSSYGGDGVFFWEIEKPVHRHGAIMVRPEASLPDLRRLVLQIIQFGLYRNDICASCGAGGSDIHVAEEKTAGGATKHKCKCLKCGFLSLRSRCFNCKQPIMKNQAWWSYHDLHPTDVWNIKCWACGSLL